MFKRFCLLICIIYLLGPKGFGQNNISLTNLNVQNGLSNNSVTCVLQDKYGFIWMGTYDGLNRFDGYAFKIFRNELNDSNSIGNNHIVALKENDNNSIWVGTLKGVSLFDYRTSLFHQAYYLPWKQTIPEKINARVKDIYVDNTGNTFVATENNGLLIKTKNSKLFHQVIFENRADFNVSAISFFKQNEIFVFVKDHGLCVFDSHSDKLSLVKEQINNATSLILNKDQSALLMGTEQGLYAYSIQSGIIKDYNKSLDNFNITNITFDSTNKMWVSTDGNGLCVLSDKGQLLYNYTQGRDNYSIKSNAVYYTYIDNCNRKWIATLRGGISLLNNAPNLFNTIKQNPYSNNTLVSNFVLSFCEDENNNIWIGTDGGGISYWDPRKNNYTNYVHNTIDPTSLKSNYVVSILNDYKNRVWVATFNGGIDLFDKKNNRFIYYPCYNPIREKYNVNLWMLYQDSHHHIWAGSTRDDALFRYNELKGQFELFDNKLINIHTLYEDKEGNLWAGNYSQLIKIDTLYKRHKYINIGYAIRTIIEDSSDRLWLGTEGGGIFIYNKVKKSIVQFTKQDGLPSNTVLCLLKDKNGNIWGSTYNGIFEYKMKGKRFINYNADDGLQSNQFSYNAALALKDGEFLFGGIGGFNKFFPEKIQKNHERIPLLVTDFEINNSPIEKTPYLNKNFSPIDFKDVTIPYNESNISISFVGLDYSKQSNILYTYFLEGWDKVWAKPSKTHNAYYSRLYEGNYILHIRTVNPDGSWNGSEKLISIKILPPWYRTWWAYILYLIAFLTVIYLYLSYKKRQTKLEYEVKLARINAEVEKDLNERKISFFTNISHEFRTMLTLIINPIKELMNNEDEIGKPEAVKMAYKNSKRMLSLVGQLLLFRKTDNEESLLRISKLNLSELSKEVFESFLFQAKTKKIEYQFICENDAIEIYGDFEKIEIILFNLISNAMKYTPEMGKVSLELKEEDAGVEIIISDSGKGIPIEVGEKIFEKYYQINNLGSTSKTGFGIGLFLVKEFINKHHGQITFSSKIGKGTTFYIHLLKGESHLHGIQMVESELQGRGLVDEIINTDDDDLDSKIVAIDIAGIKDFTTEKKSLLIAEDNAEIRTYIKKIFAEEYNILEVDNGKSAFSLIEKYKPDLIILDLIMPGLYGDELCQLIKSDETLNHTPVIILTAEVSNEIKLRCVESGADDYITKPFDKDLLIARVHNLLKTKSSLQKYFYNEVTLKENNFHISPEDKAFLDRCISIIENHFEDDQFEVKVIADELCMSHSNLYKKIHQISGYSVSGFVRFVRLRKAAELFINSTNNVGEVAFMVGFNDIKYFRSEFQKVFELTPSAYIKKYRKPFQKAFLIKKDPKMK